jgi:hypothetical protein
MLSRWLLLLVLGVAGAGALRAADSAAAPAEKFNTVTVPPVKTSIYIGSVTLTAPTFTRRGSTYSSTYTAKVFPFFFMGEKGTIAVTFTDDDLAKLAKGEPVDFKGEGRNEDGEPRHVEGKATPADAASGKLKVRIWVSPKIELIFNTTYRFGGESK